MCFLSLVVPFVENSISILPKNDPIEAGILGRDFFKKFKTDLLLHNKRSVLNFFKIKMSYSQTIQVRNWDKKQEWKAIVEA